MYIFLSSFITFMTIMIYYKISQKKKLKKLNRYHDIMDNYISNRTDNRTNNQIISYSNVIKNACR